jgi:hypothetical protein
MANANGGICITYTKDAHSHLTITDHLDRFSTNTTVLTVVDAPNGLFWTPVNPPVLFKKRKLKFIIIGTKVAATGGAASGPDSGDLTITLSDPTNTIILNPVPVDYIEDP